MTPSTAFRILRIRPLLRLNGTIERVESLQAKCGSCGDESRMSRGQGLTDAVGGGGAHLSRMRGDGDFDRRPSVGSLGSADENG